ncbi:MAG: beta-L-arabinofuranosidase domain-containing protein [Pirellulales bacterium]
MKPTYRLLSGLSALAAVVSAAAMLSAAEPQASKPAANYGRPFETPTQRALVPLPPGAVEPAGWLRDWCLAAKDGYTGHMDEVDEEFKRAWAVDHKMTGERLTWPKGAWPYEGGGYWFDGLVRLGYILHDDALIQQAKKRLDVVVTHMNPNGIVFLWWLDKKNPDDMKAIAADGGWPIWASGLLGRAMVAYYEGSRDGRVLQTLETAYGTDRDSVRLGWSMSNPLPALETYTWTGNKEIAAALTTLFSKDGGGKNTLDASWNRYRQMPRMEPGAEANDHVVHFLESTTPWSLGYLWTGNREFLDAALGWHDLLVRDSMQPSGVPVADEYYGPTGAFRGTETCDVAGYLWSQILLLSISGQGRMADRAERAFFNAGPATVARDFKTHVYFQSPNRFAENSPPCPHGPGASGCNYKTKHFPLCCTAALNRIVPNYVMHLWMATYDNGLVTAHYGPCKVSALVADRVPVEIVCRTDYPFNEVIDMSVKPEREATFPLSFRIPGWCKNPELSVNGSGVKIAPDANGFVRVERLWKPGDAVRLRFPMTVRVETGRDNNAQGAPYASVSYGPLLFALPIADTQGPNVPDPAAKWSYALDAQGEKLGADITVERQAMPGRWNWPLESPLKLRGNAVAIDWKPAPGAPRLPAEASGKGASSEQITLVPYGCTKFRISMFPVTEEVLKLSGLKAPPQPAGQ